MKRFLRKFLIFCIPFVLLLSFFFTFEPYDYFAVKHDAWYLSRSLSSTRELLLNHPENIILGDSRMANLNSDYIMEVSGERYLNMAYGGATMNESIQQFWYAVAHTQLKKVVIGISFYNMNGHLYSDRLGDVIAQAENPFKFIGDYGYWMEAVQHAGDKASNAWADVTGHDDARITYDDPSSLDYIDPPHTDDEIEGYRADLYQYAIEINAYMQEYDMQLYTEQLVEIAHYCDENNIELLFVIAPCNRSIWELCVFPSFFDVAISHYKKQLKSVATVYDAEFYNDFAKNDDLFNDGHHLVKDEKLRMIRIIFGGEDSPYYLKTTAAQYNAGNYILTDQMSIDRPEIE